MHHCRKPWILCAIASLFIHGAVLSVALPWRGGSNMEDIIEVALVAQDFHSGGVGKADASALPLPGKAKSRQTKAFAGEKNAPAGSKAAPVGRANQPDTGHPAPHMAESPARVPMSNQSTPPLPQGAQAGAGPGGGGIPQNSGKGQISADATSGTDVSGTVFGSQNPSGGGSGNYGNVQFGGPNGPQFLHREIPEYPLYARRRRKEGKVLLLLHVTEQGRLTSVEVVEASDPVFIGPSLKAVKKSTFTPAIRNGAYVAVKTLLPIRFVLDEEISTAQLRNN